MVKMFAGVLVCSTATAADVSANKAQAKMHPLTMDFQALLATCRCARLNVSALVPVDECWPHQCLHVVKKKRLRDSFTSHCPVRNVQRP